MNKNVPLNLIVLSLVMLFCTESNASSLKGSGAFGANKYQDFGLVGKWTLKEKSKPKVKSKSKNLEEDDSSEEGSKILTSIQSTKSSGTITNEYKLGYDSKISEVTYCDLNAYYRTEPSDVHVIGFQPEFSFDYDDLIFKELSTGFTLGMDISRSTTQTQITPKKTISEGFTTAGITLGINQEIMEGLKASFSASFFHYTEPQTKFPAAVKRLNNLRPVDSALSTSGNPEKTFTLGLSWEITEKWSSAYSISSTKTHFDGLTSIYSSLEVDHVFSDRWSAGLGYSWSSSASTSGSLEATYSW